MNPFAALVCPIVNRPGDPITEPKRLVRKRYLPPERPTREPLDTDLLVNPWGLPSMPCRILVLIVSGKTRKQAANELRISVKTVDTHMERAKQRMGVHTLLQAALKFDRHYRKAA